MRCAQLVYTFTCSSPLRSRRRSAVYKVRKIARSSWSRPSAHTPVDVATEPDITVPAVLEFYSGLLLVFF